MMSLVSPNSAVMKKTFGCSYEVDGGGGGVMQLELQHQTREKSLVAKATFTSRAPSLKILEKKDRNEE